MIPFIVMFGSIVELLLMNLEKVFEYPPVKIILKLQLKEFFIFLTILFTNP